MKKYMKNLINSDKEKACVIANKKNLFSEVKYHIPQIHLLDKTKVHNFIPLQFSRVAP